MSARIERVEEFLEDQVRKGIGAGKCVERMLSHENIRNKEPKPRRVNWRPKHHLRFVKEKVSNFKQRGERQEPVGKKQEKTVHYPFQTKRF